MFCFIFLYQTCSYDNACFWCVFFVVVVGILYFSWLIVVSLRYVIVGVEFSLLSLCFRCCWSDLLLLFCVDVSIIIMFVSIVYYGCCLMLFRCYGHFDTLLLSIINNVVHICLILCVCYGHYTHRYFQNIYTLLRSTVQKNRCCLRGTHICRSHSHCNQLCSKQRLGEYNHW